MALTIHTPIGDGADRFAGILLKLETTPSPDLVLIPLGIRQGATAEARIIAILPDGGREVLSAEDACFLARCLRAEGAYVEAGAHADQLVAAASAAERRATAAIAAHAGGQIVQLPRAFVGGRR